MEDGSLDAWCGGSGIWTQLSFSNILEEGGRIDITGLSPHSRSRVLQSLKRHASWMLEQDCIIHLKRIDPPDDNLLRWFDDTVVPGHPQIRSEHCRCPVGWAHTKMRTWFYL